ncbi:MAG TPA: efflux RND transporter permease subunit, partial [Saprospiraceae bacterium]|nr:efflux RND transporter permease subunit [Saprospiraceae bacterium]
MNTLPIVINKNVYPGTTFFKVYAAEERPLSLFRINGKNNIRVSFIPESDVNQLQLGAQIKQAIASIDLPVNYQLLKEYDTTEFIQTELDKIKERTLYSVCILMAFVLLIYRSYKHIFIIISGLLITAGISFVLYYLGKVQLNLYSLAAITISFGIVIDNLIVMVDHYGKYQNLRVFPAIISATFTTLSALVVFWFLPEELRWNLTDFGRILLINLVVSIWVAWMFIPAVMVQIKYPFKNEKRQMGNENLNMLQAFYSKYLIFASKYRRSILLLMVLMFGLPFFMLPTRHKTSEWYNNTIGSDWYLEYVRPYVNKYLGGTLRLFSDYVYTRSS